MAGAREDAEVRTMMRTGDWAAANCRHWCSAYVVYHEKVYGLAPEEARRAAWRKRTTFLAARVLRDSFGGDAEAMADFCWWVWERERKLELYWTERRRTGTATGEPRRLEAEAMFSDRMVSRYKFARLRERPDDGG